jgi:ribonucleoside-diphosphate reductase alpha chain
MLIRREMSVPPRASASVSPFTDALAAEAWDAWFRWRDPDRLYDISIDATFSRVARALAQAEPTSTASVFEKRVTDAFASWQLLLDERLLATAGTDRPSWANDNLAAVLNAAVFVRGRFSGNARFDHAAFAAMAELAVQALDNACALATHRSPATPIGLQVGLTGLGDALAFLRLGYDSPCARAEAAAIARSLAEGCYRGTVRLARERGAALRLADNDAGMHALLKQLPDDLVGDAEQYGLRHAQLTAITSHPRLALFANDVTDAIDPLRRTADVFKSTGSPRAIRAPGYAMSVAQELYEPHAMPHAVHESVADVSVSAQIEMRGAVQRWIDRPISYPLVVARIPSVDEQRQQRVFAAAHRLGELNWTSIEAISTRKPLVLTE